MNVFLAIGIVAIVIMLLTFDVSYDEIWNNLRRAGWWFIAVVLIWLPIYLLNACSWNVIINNGSKHKAIPFVKVLKYTISGYALNYVTPVGVLGGEPYRIMEIKPYLGTAKATSSVILYAMMHIFSHFIFWAFSIVLYILMYFDRIDMMMGLFLVIVAALFLYERLQERFGHEDASCFHPCSRIKAQGEAICRRKKGYCKTHRRTDSRASPSE